MASDFTTINQGETPINPRPLDTGNRFTWEQLEAQLAPLGIKKEHISPEDMRELLNARRTSSLTMNQADKHGTVTPVQGRLFVYDDPGKGPRVELIPRQLERTPAPRYLGYQLTHEDNIRLQRTGEMGRPVPLIDKETNAQFMGLLGYDPSTNRLTVFRQERFTPPTVLLGVAITEKQQEALRNHGVIRVKNMTGMDGKPFTADVQVSAHKRGLKFTAVNQAALNALQEKRDTQRNGPQPVSPASQPSRQADEQWRKTIVTAQDGNGLLVRKSAGALTYQDMIRVNKSTDGPAEFRPLTLIHEGQALKSPHEQAKIEILDYRKLVNGQSVSPKVVASPAAIRQAEQKFGTPSATHKPSIEIQPSGVTPPQDQPVSKDQTRKGGVGR